MILIDCERKFTSNLPALPDFQIASAELFLCLAFKNASHLLETASYSADMTGLAYASNTVAVSSICVEISYYIISSLLAKRRAIDLPLRHMPTDTNLR